MHCNTATALLLAVLPAAYGLATPNSMTSFSSATSPVSLRSVLDKDLDGSYCIRDGDSFAIYTETWGATNAGCGGGVLDNLRGSCCDNIVDWGCDRAGDHGAKMSFKVGCAVYGGHCVEDAIWLASPVDRRETGVTCQDGHL